MKPFTTHTGIAAPIDRVNVDTDMIIPKQFLRKIDRTGFGRHLFHEIRYLDYEGTKENPDFILNKNVFRKATVLLARDNFGCGSSREHAAWAIAEYGFRVIIAPSFADIFYNNCVNNGILPVALKSNIVDKMFEAVHKTPGLEISADLKTQTVTYHDGREYKFKIQSFPKTCLLKGLDLIGWTQQFEKDISSFEARTKKEREWLKDA